MCIYSILPFIYLFLASIVHAMWFNFLQDQDVSGPEGMAEVRSIYRTMQ